MERMEKIKRYLALYFYTLLFVILLPILLSYSLGYQIDYKALHIYKTGIISLRSQPSGASIYLNGSLLTLLTPARLEELRPGSYNIEVRKEGYYPWQQQLVVRPNMVTKAEEIILFPVSQEIAKISTRETSHFMIPDKRNIYYMTNSGLFKSNVDGTGFKRLSPHSNWPPAVKGDMSSPDGDKILFFDDNHIWVIYLKQDVPQEGAAAATVEDIVTTDEPISEVFWYSQSSHIVFVAGKDLNIIELSGHAARNIVRLYRFNSIPKSLNYDPGSDSLYFIDTVKVADAKERNYIYRIDLRRKFFDQLMDRFKFKKEPDIIKYEKQ